MSHAEVYKAFRQYFPTYVGENIAAWFRVAFEKQTAMNL